MRLAEDRFVLDLITTDLHNCGMVPRRLRILGSKTFTSLNSRLDGDEEEKALDRLLQLQGLSHVLHHTRPCGNAPVTSPTADLKLADWTLAGECLATLLVEGLVTCCLSLAVPLNGGTLAEWRSTERLNSHSERCEKRETWCGRPQMFRSNGKCQERFQGQVGRPRHKQHARDAAEGARKGRMFQEPVGRPRPKKKKRDTSRATTKKTGPWKRRTCSTTLTWTRKREFESNMMLKQETITGRMVGPRETTSEQKGKRHTRF